MVGSTNPRYLALKLRTAEEFSERAKRQFSTGYVAGLRQAIATKYDVSISKATIARILKGNRGEFEKVQAICDYFGVLLEDACEVLNHTTEEQTEEINELVARARQVNFIFESADPRSSRDQSSWVRENFVELDMVEVDKLPSEYPALNRENLSNSEEDIEDEFDRMGIRLLRGRKITATDVLRQCSKAIVFGDPGSGKTSFLQSAAIRCRNGEILEQYVPAYVEIRHYCVSGGAETLLTYIERSFESCEIDSQQLESILNAGRVLFLLDGFDESPEEDLLRIHNMIQELVSRYPKCRFICTARLGLGSKFFIRGATKIIISPFYSNKQIPDFVRRWFRFHGNDSVVAESMLERLYSARCVGIREIARRPVLLNLLCLTYELNGDFPERRAEVFASGLSALASKAQRKSLTPIAEAPYFKVKDIQNILARIASYFFIHLHKKVLFSVRDVERIIREYCQEVHGINPNTVDGSTILQGIEQFNGLLIRWGEVYCSFSHLTYQEYFTAEYLVDFNQYTDVYQYIAERRWSFVIELVAELVPGSESWPFFLGFKSTIDGSVNGDTKLVNFLQTTDKAATFVTYSVRTDKPYIQSLIRAWYFVYAIENTGSINSVHNYYQRFDLPDFDFATSMVDNHILQGHEALYKAYHCCKDNKQATHFENYARTLREFFTREQKRREVEIIEGWLGLIVEQQARYDNKNEWWEAKRHGWQRKVAQFLSTLGLPHTYELNHEQVKRLRTYYRVSKLLSNCINRSNLSDARFSEIADSILKLTYLFPDHDRYNSDL